MNVWELHLPSSSCAGELRNSDPAVFTTHNLGKSWNIVDREGLFSPEMEESSVAAARKAERSLWFFPLLPQQGVIVSLEKLDLDK